MDKTTQLEGIVNYARRILESDASGHSMDHVERVVRLARKISYTVPCNEFLVVAGAYLHDVIDDKLVANVEHGRNELFMYLTKIGMSMDEVSNLFHIIDNVSFSSSFGQSSGRLSVEAKIVQDADRLDAVGAIGIGRTFYYGGYAGHKMHDPKIKPRNLKTKVDYRNNETVINHFYEKLLRLPKLMNTEYARDLALERQKIMTAFLDSFLSEWEGPGK